MIKALKATAGISPVSYGLPINATLFSEAVSLLQHLIKTPSFSGAEAEAANIVNHYLASYSIKTSRKGNNIWCYNKYFNEANPTVLLNSHLDTVQPNEGYTINPFNAEINNGRLYGLGSNDAGGCLVSLVATFLHFYSYKGLGFNLCLALTAEEENSGPNGIRSVLPHLGRLDLGIVGEPTLLEIAVEEKGNLVLDCVSSGRSGHAAREEGDNAIYKCLADMQWFRGFQFPKNYLGLSPVKMTVTAIKAGLQHNIIPAKCEFTVDIRYDNTVTASQIIQVVEKNVSVNILQRPGALGASSIPINHPIVKTGIAIGCKTYSSPTSSDQAWLSIPSIKLGPGDSARSHTADEYIFLEEIKKGINLYIKLLDSLPLMLINNPNKYSNEIKHFDN